MYNIYNKKGKYITSTETWGRAIRLANTYSSDMSTIVTVRDLNDKKMLEFESGRLIEDTKQIKHSYRLTTMSNNVVWRRSLKKALQDMQTLSMCESEGYTCVLCDMTDDAYVCVYKDGEIQ